MNVVMCTSALIHVFNIVLTFFFYPAGALVMHLQSEYIPDVTDEYNA